MHIRRGYIVSVVHVAMNPVGLFWILCMPVLVLVLVMVKVEDARRVLVPIAARTAMVLRKLRKISRRIRCWRLVRQVCR